MTANRFFFLRRYKQFLLLPTRCCAGHIGVRLQMFVVFFVAVMIWVTFAMTLRDTWQTWEDDLDERQARYAESSCL